MLISIITVCKNAKETIEETLLSVVNQTYIEIEYVIMDGVSTDGTLEIINEYIDRCPIKLYSQKDTGIYNAMNQAIELINGEYVFYLNSGDTFYSDKTLEQVVEKINSVKVDILYGDVNFKYKNSVLRKHYVKYKMLNSLFLSFGYTICHQAVFAKLELLQRNRFDENYIFWADQEWLMHCMSEKVAISTINEVICNYDMYGVSSNANNYMIVKNESDLIVKKYKPYIYWLLRPIKIMVRKIKEI